MKDSNHLSETTTQLKLRREAKILRDSMVLTPVDNFPNLSAYKDAVGDFHGLYASDKNRSDADKKSAVIQFGGRSGLTKHINDVHASLAEAFDCQHASLRLLSGLHAHIVLFMGIAPIGGKVALLPVEAGGHFATPGILERLGLSIVELPCDLSKGCLDTEAALAVIDQEDPDILFIDRSEGLKYEDFSALGRCNVPVRIFDSSQYAAQIMTGLYENPFEWGFNLQVLTLHKSFPGPQKAALVCNDDGVWKDVLAGLSAYVSSSHIENSLLVGLILERKAELKEYAKRLILTKVELENQLIEAGLPVIASSKFGTSAWPVTQHIWLGHDDQDQAFSAWKAFEQNRIQTNYRKLPYHLGWGQRIGVTAAVSRGFMPNHCRDLATMMAEALTHPQSRCVRQKVTSLVQSMAPYAPFGT